MNFLRAESAKADGILDALWTAMGDFAEGGPQGDDMTCPGAVPARSRVVAGDCRHERTVPRSTTVEVRLPSRMGYEKVAMSTAAAVAKLMGFREDRVEDLKTAVAEACINAIEHGNRLNEKPSVGVVLSAGTDALEVKVIDDGKGMKQTTAKARYRPQDSRRGRSARDGHVPDPGAGRRSGVGEGLERTEAAMSGW